ncbi:MAG: aldo/keto reductase [Candidatus Eisenbacteria bacterium]|uniref:Aldo/keto reductase n=1 Tax=Eiseniibacteriota bacterium TaxID=2212470 RepID=A0A956LXB8_UNCEI|nr:aldo/keto reductase [Candidatus Eisenbacteria bacterium]
MQTRPWGQDGPQVPVIGQGTRELEAYDPGDVERAILAGLDAGMTHIDTAEMYGSGRVEELLGRVLEGRRDEIFLVSKVLPSNASRKKVLAACEGSLRRLRTDCLDGYLLHWPGSHPIAETLGAFEELMAAGKIRSYGVSNFDERRLREIQKTFPEARIACNQVLYHLEARAIEHRVLPEYRAAGATVVGYSPFGAGKFPGPRHQGRRVLDAIAARHDATAYQVALAFLIREDDTLAIPRTSNAAHARANAEAASVRLTAEDLQEIDRAFPQGPPRASLPTA